MPLPSTFFGVTAKQLVVMVTVGGLAAYFFNHQDEPTPDNLALEAFIRSQQQVCEQVGAVVGITLVREVEAYPAYNAAGYKRSMFTVQGEHGQVLVTLKQDEQGIEMTQIRRP